ncbi:MAG: response regulator [Gammaproteobacteria bacterium]|nr:response regulator [Gammaproteobacteria bacterium]
MSDSNLNLTEIYIVLVEASDTQVQIILNQFQSLQVSNIKVVTNGQQAIDTIHRDIPDLIISSMYLEDMTAVELIYQIRNNEQTEGLPFILMSSETSFGALDPIKQAGIVDILKKPFGIGDLKRSLDRALEVINISEIIDEIADIEMDYVRVLIVDDSPMATKHTCRFLYSLGIEDIDTASNGNEAIEYIDNNFYDLIITDYNMPERDGPSLTRYIRSHESTNSTIPVLMITSESDVEKIKIAKQAGVNAICGKPYENHELLSLIKDVLT